MYGYNPWAWWYWTLATLPVAGGEVPRRPAPAAPQVVTRTTGEGTARTCIQGGTFRYQPNVTVEVLRSRRLREGLFYLVLTTDGCAGWVPAQHLAITRRQVGDGGPAGDDDLAVAFADDD